MNSLRFSWTETFDEVATGWSRLLLPTRLAGLVDRRGECHVRQREIQSALGSHGEVPHAPRGVKNQLG